LEATNKQIGIPKNTFSRKRVPTCAEDSAKDEPHPRLTGVPVFGNWLRLLALGPPYNIAGHRHRQSNQNKVRGENKGRGDINPKDQTLNLLRIRRSNLRFRVPCVPLQRQS